MHAEVQDTRSARTYRGIDRATSDTRAVHLREGKKHSLMGHLALRYDFKSVARARKVYDATAERRGRSAFCRGSRGGNFLCGGVHVRASGRAGGFGGQAEES